MIQPLTMAELIDRLGQAERVQTASYCRMLEIEDLLALLPVGMTLPVTIAMFEPLNDEWRLANEMWRESRELVAEYAAQLDRFVR